MNWEKAVSELLMSVRYRGVFPTLKNHFKLLIETLKFADTVRKRRRRVAKKLDKLFNSTVAYGPFRGMKLSKNPWWSFADRASLFLGLYEQEVLESLTKVPADYRTFIDLGAADGYYGVGVLVNRMFDKSYCFEISEEGRYVIKENAKLNGVEDRIVIKGIAEKDFYKCLSPAEMERVVILSDVEGAEFDLFDASTFGALKKAIIIMEIHDWFFDDGDMRLRKLNNVAKATHSITSMTMGGRDLSKFPELQRLHDNDRWLICSEGRKQAMVWLRFDPV